MILWITGISGSGKTTLGKHFYKQFIKKKKNTIYLDGDEFRSLFGNDLKYTIKDRDTNAKRMTSFVRYISCQKINLIISANITSEKYRKWCRKNLKNFFQVYIRATIKQLKKRDYKSLYSKAFSGKIKNVMGVDLPFDEPKNIDLFLENNGSKKSFLEKIILVKKFLKEKKIKIH
jgi:adenylylsulfate kinase-like enzyme